MSEQKIWDDLQENTCGFCIFSRKLPDNERLSCIKRNGFFEFSDTCRKFKFDILKKEVGRRRIPDFSKFSAENFEL